MSVDKLVDSTQLDSDLTSVANAIRAKSGGSGQLAFPSGFVSEIGNIPSGGGGTHNLPSGFTEYEYIEATGTQCINTGYTPVSDTEIIATMERTEVQSYQSTDWGVTPTPKATSGGTYFSWGSATDKSSSTWWNPDSLFGKKTIKVNKNGLYDLAGTVRVSFGTPTWTSGNLTIHLCCRNNNGTQERFCKIRVYYWAAYENGTKMIELIPAMRNSDSALGMYDTVSGNFLTNAGTGTLVGGAF